MALQSQQSASYLSQGFQSDQPAGEIPCPGPESVEHQIMFDDEVQEEDTR